MNIRYLAFVCSMSTLLLASEKSFVNNFEFAESILRDIENHYHLPPNDLATSDEMENYVLGSTFGTFPPCFIVLNRTIMDDQQEIISTLAHEVGHVKDRSQLKHTQALTAYYALAAATPNLFAYATSRLLSFKAFTNTALYTACTAAGIASAVFFHKETDRIISRHLEKRADLIGLDYLVSYHQFEAICRKVAYLERSQFFHYSPGPEHPCAQEQFQYTKKFLEKKGISLTSEFTEHDHILNGHITLSKDDQKLYGLTWQWKPKC